MSVVAVQVTSTALLVKATSTTKRKQVILSNRGANTVWIIVGEAAVDEEGIPLDTGVSVGLSELLSQDKLNLAINAIAPAGITDVSVYAL